MNVRATGAAAPTGPLPRFWAAWEGFWLRPQPALAVGVLRIVTFGVLLSYLLVGEFQWFLHLEQVDPWFFRPIPLVGVFGIGPVPAGVAPMLQIVLVGFGLCGLLGLATRLSAAVCAAGFFYAITQVYSFTNIHHGDGLLGLALVTLAFYGGPTAPAVRVPWRSGGWLACDLAQPVAAWPVQFIRVQIALVYFLSGYAKLVLAGPGWADGTTLQHYLLLRGQPAGYWLAAQPTLVMVLAAFTLVMQLTFPVVLRWPRLGWFYVPAALGFHLGSQWMLGLGFHHFFPFLLLFLDYAAVPRWLAAQRARLQPAVLPVGAR